MDKLSWKPHLNFYYNNFCTTSYFMTSDKIFKMQRLFLKNIYHSDNSQGMTRKHKRNFNDRRDIYADIPLPPPPTPHVFTLMLKNSILTDLTACIIFIFLFFSPPPSQVLMGEVIWYLSLLEANYIGMRLQNCFKWNRWYFFSHEGDGRVLTKVYKKLNQYYHLKLILY